MMHAHAPEQNRFELRPRSMSEVVLFQRASQLLLLAIGEQTFSAELLGDVPTLIAIEAEHQGGCLSGLIIARRHVFELLVQELIADPIKPQRHFAVSVLWTNCSLRLWLRASQMMKSTEFPTVAESSNNRV